VLTVLQQFDRGKLIAPIRDRDLFALIPSWTFFAPRPAVRDLNILVRDELPGGEKSPWRELDDLEPSPWRFLWNPRKRSRKAAGDLAMCVCDLPYEKDLEPELYALDLSYLALLNHIMNVRPNPLAQRRQFMLTRSRGYSEEREPEVRFVSWFHRCE
jgi:hypothetical protein